MEREAPRRDRSRPGIGGVGRLVRIILLLAALIVLGTAGFVIVEGWGFFDAFYMAVITITTVGYGEVHPLSTAGRAFVIVYLLIGLGVFTYSVIQLGEHAVRANVRDWLMRRRMDTAIKSMSGHFIVCGFGRMGRTVCRELASHKVPFLAIDRDADALEECRSAGWPWLVGDATDDETLTTAGVTRARGLAAVMGSDADNVYIVLSARLMSRSIQIIARAADEKSVPKLERAGANRVVGLYDVGATRMAHLLVNPNLQDFIEVLTTQGGQLELAEIAVSESALYAGLRLDQTDFRARGITIVAIRSADGRLSLAPGASAVIEPGQTLIALGHAGATAGLNGR